jgi:hypothetical protein
MDSYPGALIRGTLQMTGDCLTLGDSTVAWPAGSSWDPASRAVTFSGDFEGAAPVPVGTQFVGGGGFYSPSDDYSSVFGAAAGTLRRCLSETGASTIVFAYPDVD